MEKEIKAENTPSLDEDLSNAGNIFRLCVMNKFDWSEATYYRKRNFNTIDTLQQMYLLNLFESILIVIRQRNCQAYRRIPMLQAYKPSRTITIPIAKALHEILMEFKTMHRDIVVLNFKWSEAKYYRVLPCLSIGKASNPANACASHGSAAHLVAIYLKELAKFRTRKKLKRPKNDTSVSVLIEVVKNHFTKMHAMQKREVI